jgi:hypothetical protein
MVLLAGPDARESPHQALANFARSPAGMLALDEKAVDGHRDTDVGSDRLTLELPIPGTLAIRAVVDG